MAEAVCKQKNVYSEYAQYESRFGSYNDCESLYLLDFKEEFVEAGFFHAGNDDESICYYCGGGLKDWDVLDNSRRPPHEQGFSPLDDVINSGAVSRK